MANNDNSKIGIMDPKGVNLNPLTGVPYSDIYKVLSSDPEKGWSLYPAYERATDILDSLRDNQVTLIIAGTGSGKTVLTPKFGLHYTDYEGKVGVTLPKKSATSSAAEFAALTLDVPLGKDIGYVHKGSPKEMISKDNKIVYMTDGTLVMKQIKDRYLSEFKVIIIDEAHERKVQIDLILLFLKEILQSGKRPDLRVIIMSATIDGKKYQQYFDGITSKILNISGKPNYPIDVHFLATPTTNYLKDGYEIVQGLLNSGIKDDILFFITASEEAKKLCKMVRPAYPKVYCIELFSDMDKKMQVYALSKDKFRELGDYETKVIMATNVAESSLTVDGLKYVVDSCHEFHNSYDPSVMGYIMERKLITQSQAIQRRGRVGRTEPGTCYHLVTEQQFNALNKYPAPDILENDMTIELLKIIITSTNQSFDEGVIIMNKLMDIPKQKFIDVAYGLYQIYRIIDSENRLTKIGKELTSFSTLSINQSLFLIYSYQFHCAKDASIIIAMIEILKGNLSNLFFKADDSQNKVSNQIIKKLSDKSGDHLTFLKIYNLYVNTNDKKKWANQYRIKLDILGRVKQIADTYYYRVINISKAYQEARVVEVPVNIRLVRALRLSHEHLLADKLTSIYPSTKTTGTINKNSAIHNFYERNKLANKKFIYNELTRNSGKWEFSCVTIMKKIK